MSDKCSSVRGTSILQLCLSREDWGSVVSKKHPRPHPAPIRAGAGDSKGRLMTEHSGAESGGEGDEEEDRQREGKLQDSKACRCMKEEWGAGTPWKKKISALRSSYEQHGPKAESGTPSRTSLTCELSMVAELELQEVQFGNGEKNKHFVQSSMPTERLDRLGCREVLHGAANCFQVCRPISFSLGPRIERLLQSERTNKCCLLHRLWDMRGGKFWAESSQKVSYRASVLRREFHRSINELGSGPLTPSVCKARVQQVGNWQLWGPVGEMSDECSVVSAPAWFQPDLYEPGERAAY